jgi:hypothetical protein
MDPIMAAVNLIDEAVRVIRYLRLSPTRAARAVEEGFPLEFMQRLEWDIAGGWLLSRLGRLTPCGCLAFRGEFIAYDITCPIHDPLDDATFGTLDDDDDSFEWVDT